jgi:hypothetical protein
MMHIPHLGGFSPKRWKQVVDVMLEKSPGDSRTHRLCIVALQESDFNQSIRPAIVRPVMHWLEDNQKIPSMQHGSRPAKLCISTVLNKQLSFEIAWYKKQSLAYIENDATGCYDRIVTPLVLLFLRKYGVPKTTLASLSKTWEGTSHKIKTLYGISEEEYTNSLEYFLFRPGQGSTIGPTLWPICFILITLSLSPTAPKMTFTSTDNKTTSNSIGDAFVDDTGLGCTINSTHSKPEETLSQQLNLLGQEWERLLFSTRGVLNLSKCFWFLITWKWVGSTAKLATIAQSPASLHMTAGINPSTREIHLIESTESFRTLGVIISPSCSTKGSMEKLQQIATAYARNVAGSHLTREETIMSYVQHLLPKLRFQLPALSLSKSQCNKITSIALMAALPKMHMNRNTARSIIALGGMALPDLYIFQGIDK